MSPHVPHLDGSTSPHRDDRVTDPVVIVGGGHNGWSCWRPRTSPAAGPGPTRPSRGYWFNTRAAAHNIINKTRILAELDLAGAGLEYLEMSPFATGFFRDGRIVRFHRSVEQTCDSIAEVGTRAEAYRAFMDRDPAGQDRGHRPGVRVHPRWGPQGRKRQAGPAAAGHLELTRLRGHHVVADGSGCQA